MMTNTAIASDNFLFTLNNLPSPESEDYRLGLMWAYSYGRDAGMEFDEIYDKLRFKIPKGLPSKRENMILYDPTIANFPEDEPDEEIEEPEAIAEYQESAPEKPHDDELKRLEERLKTPNLDDDEVAELLREIKFIKLLQRTHNVADLLLENPTEPDQIFTDFLDKGDKLAIIAPTKGKKSLLTLELSIHLAAGVDFLQLKVPKARRVVYVNMEIQPNHLHRRILSICKSIGIHPHDIADRFHIINCRGLGIEGPEGVDLIARIIESLEAEFVEVDPLYKIQGGSENDIESGKKILNSFDGLIARTGAALGYVHHDTKGNSGDRNMVDRGSGSNILNRDYDCAIMMTPHATDKDAIVIDTVMRNYKQREPFTASFVEDEDGGYHFEERTDIVPEKKTSKTRTPATALPAYLPAAISILGDTDMEMGLFKTAFKLKTGLSDNRIRDFINWARAGGNPTLSTREERGGRGHYRKLISVAGGDLNE